MEELTEAAIVASTSPEPKLELPESHGEGFSADLFQDPEGFYQPEKPATFTSFVFKLPNREISLGDNTLITEQVLRLRLVGHNPLWGHHLWNAGRVLADTFLQSTTQCPQWQEEAGECGSENLPLLVKGRDILELGAGAGLPGIVSAIVGARRVLITDYPDEELIENINWNINECRRWMDKDCKIAAEAYLWGAAPSPSMRAGFDVLVLGDLLFNHSEHVKLVRSITLNLRRRPESMALVFFTPYRPWLLDKDLAFFDIAEREGFKAQKLGEKIMPEVMFKEDRGDELLRRTVYCYMLTWSSSTETDLFEYTGT